MHRGHPDTWPHPSPNPIVYLVSQPQGVYFRALGWHGVTEAEGETGEVFKRPAAPLWMVTGKVWLPTGFPGQCWLVPSPENDVKFPRDTSSSEHLAWVSQSSRRCCGAPRWTWLFCVGFGCMDCKSETVKVLEGNMDVQFLVYNFRVEIFLKHF